MRNCLTLVIGILLIVTSSYATNSEYPQTREQRRADEMGSVLGGEGLVFHPGKMRNDTTKTKNSKVNKYLWDAVIDELSIAPLIVKDDQNGVISTDWYSDNADPKRSMKVTVNIVGDVIAPEALRITIQQRVLQNGRWLEEVVKPDLLSAFEMSILHKSRAQYIKSNQ